MLSALEERRVCRQCNKDINRDFLPSLPCGHLYCMTCIDAMTRDRRRSWSLPCPAEGCPGIFAIVAPSEPECRPKPSVQPPFIADRYLVEVTHRATVDKPPSATRTKVMGMALLEDSLYVVSGKKYIFEFNVADLDQIKGPENHEIADLKWPRGMAASPRLGTLYITDWHKMFGGSLWRFKPHSDDSQQQAPQNADAATSKIDFDVEPFGVSVSQSTESSDVTVLVTCSPLLLGDEQIAVYRDDGGPSGLRVVAALTLPSSFQTPRHSLLLSSGEYAVCHGWTALKQHRLSKMQLRAGHLDEVSAYGTSGGSGDQQLRCPLSLCIDEDDSVIAVDYYNHRIQLLTSHLQLVRHLITSAKHGIRYPRHASLDAARGLLFVGSQNGTVQIFQVRQPGPTTDGGPDAVQGSDVQTHGQQA